MPDWTGEDVFIIGGGPSLKRFHWSQLKCLNAIGCNQAFQLGPSVCHVAMFGDAGFWDSYRDDLARFGGWVATNETVPDAPPWLNVYPRQDEGMSTDAVGWNGNTGAAAINLALILGASRVFLLGFDLALTGHATHWHGQSQEVQTQTHYDRFALGFFNVAQSLPDAFPGRRVYNVSDGTSRLRCFPIVGFHFAGLAKP